MENIPTHIAIIPDGNRRWATERELPPWEGHRKGSEQFKHISEAAFQLGVSYITFWAASEDNLTKRNPLEITFLVNLLKDAGHIINVLVRAKENSMFEPDALLATKEVAVRGMNLSIIHICRRLWNVGAERLVSKHRLLVQRKTITA